MRSEQGKPANADEGFPFHATGVDESRHRLDADPAGLTSPEAARRSTRYGPNSLPRPRRRGAIARLLAQFQNVLIYVLIAAASVSGLLGEWVDAGVIAGVVLINALIGWIQEGRAERALEAIRDLLSQEATVLRDGCRRRERAEVLVPGDVVLLEAGDRVPADIRLIAVRDLQAQESMLTGESAPAAKDVAPVQRDAPLGDRRCLAFSGTMVTRGSGSGFVIATGAATEVGRISAMIRSVDPLTTPLMRQLSRFGRWLTAAILMLALVSFGLGTTVHGLPPSDMFMAAVGLAVAAIPEGLPAILTIAMAIGVRRMAQRHAIVRRLPAVETLGSVGVICSDKTGTLTRNEMTVVAAEIADGSYTISGSGYRPDGVISRDGRTVDRPGEGALGTLLRAGILCSDAELRSGAESWLVSGDPMEGALLVAAAKAGFDEAETRAAWPRIDALPFEAERRYMATLNATPNGAALVVVKGAPERILELCTHQQTAAGRAPLHAAFWYERISRLANRGLRTLAFAIDEATTAERELRLDDVESGLTFLGLVGLLDPPRPEAFEAIAACRSAGIDVKMITGDHGGTAQAIARQLGLDNPQAMLTGRDIDELTDDELAQAVLRMDVIARTSPAHKLRLVEALQRHGHVVAMTGDGVNDAPALKRADIGVAMGRKGTEAAREASDIVLADDNFASIAKAVREGRCVYDNLVKALAYILPTSFGEAFVIVGAVAAGATLPISAIHVLWINMVTTVTLALALAFEPPKGDVMARPPRAPRAPILTRFLIWRIAFVTAIMVAGTNLVFHWHYGSEVDLTAARTLAVNTIVLFEVFYLFNARFLVASALRPASLSGARPALIAAAIVIGLQLAFTYAPPLQLLFGSAPIDAGAWLFAVAIAAGVFVAVEVEKSVVRRRGRSRPEKVS